MDAICNLADALHNETESAEVVLTMCLLQQLLNLLPLEVLFLLFVIRCDGILRRPDLNVSCLLCGRLFR